MIIGCLCCPTGARRCRCCPETSRSILQHHMLLYLLSSNMDQRSALTSAVTALPAVSSGAYRWWWRRREAASPSIPSGRGGIRVESEFGGRKKKIEKYKLFGGNAGRIRVTSGWRRDAPRRRKARERRAEPLRSGCSSSLRRSSRGGGALKGASGKKTPSRGKHLPPPHLPRTRWPGGVEHTFKRQGGAAGCFNKWWGIPLRIALSPTAEGGFDVSCAALHCVLPPNSDTGDVMSPDSTAREGWWWLRDGAGRPRACATEALSVEGCLCNPTQCCKWADLMLLSPYDAQNRRAFWFLWNMPGPREVDELRGGWGDSLNNRGALSGFKAVCVWVSVSVFVCVWSGGRGKPSRRHHVESCQQQGEEILQQEALPEELGPLRGELHEQSSPDSVDSLAFQHRRAGRRGREGRRRLHPDYHRGVPAVRRQRLRGVPVRGQGAGGRRAQEPRQHLLHERYPAVPEQHGAVRGVPGSGAVQGLRDDADQQQRRRRQQRQGQVQRGAGPEEAEPAAATAAAAGAGGGGGDRAAVRAGPGSLDLRVHASAQQGLQGELLHRSRGVFNTNSS